MERTCSRVPTRRRSRSCCSASPSRAAARRRSGCSKTTTAISPTSCKPSRLLVGTREQVLSIRTQPIRERGCTDTALLATVGNQRLGFELLEMMADRVDGHAQLVGKLFRREWLGALQREQDLRAKSFVRRELQRMDAHRSRILSDLLGIVN